MYPVAVKTFRSLRAGTQSFLGMGLLRFQGVLLGIALATSLLSWIFNAPAGVLNSVIYTLVIGNFTTLCFAILGDSLGPASAPRAWALFLAVLLPVAAAGAVLASAALYAVHPDFWKVPLHRFVAENVPFGMFVTVVTALCLFGASRMRERFHSTEQQLQQQVELGAIKLEAQSGDLAAAHEMQQHLLPKELPQLPRLELAGAWQPALAVGGDYFDAFPLRSGEMALCIADVSGKGMAAALLMANLQAAFRAFAADETSPGALCTRLNRALCGSVAPGRFVTFFYGVVHPQTLQLRYENAGHTPPLLLRNGVAAALEGGGTVLGLFPDAVYCDRSIALQPGDCLLMSTDGITEAARSAAPEDEFGEERLIRAALRAARGGAQGVRREVLDEVTSFCAGEFRDDASLLVLYVQPNA